ncbi:hypothetical protein OEB99_16945 [Actinotalea sp. M2MS4P-6]|uniref:hypothetical protein n=1 Tax=Actinotalea sp. M2MS4P-6 TaxID=2983762 RepID=UPI0021E4A629|nr:hypothetical protein [Actinotalea sp. M2MS4P-6]MCV2396003.1 hypothetical protein [Actinotalea sp. M2MS4P-6]
MTISDPATGVLGPAPKQPDGWRGTVWSGAVRALVLLTVALGALWLATPHLSSDHEAVTDDSSGCVITIPTGTGVSPDDEVGTCSTVVHVTNHGLIPVTISWLGADTLTGPGVSTVDLGMSADDSSPLLSGTTLGPGDELAVHVVLRAPACTQTGGSEAMSAMDGIALTADLGPVSRRTVVPARFTAEVVTKDGSDLPRCPE